GIWGLELGVSRVDSMADERGVTVWRPQPAQGYVALGDVLTAGVHMPNCQVATLAVNSGLVAFPTAFEIVWQGPDGDDLAIWRPLPPPGYVALGCVAGSREAAPPLAVVGCVAVRACVEARLGECLLLAEQGTLWAVQNAGATFEVSPAGQRLPAVHLYDLRIPLGVPPAALTPLPQLLPTAAAVVPLELVREASLPLGVASELPPLSLLCQQRYMRSRSALIRRAMSQAFQLPCVEFFKVWWDRHTPAPSANRLSIWRPNPPPGYVFLGDCASHGIYTPPPSVVVLRDSDPAAALRDGRPPSLARPINYVRVWCDEQRERQGDPLFLALWKPVPPAGFVPLGLVAGLGPRVPPLALPIRCVRADLVTTETLPRAAPEWTLPPYRQRPALSGWTTDRRTGTFTVIAGPAAGGDYGSISEGSSSGPTSPEGRRSGSSPGATFDAYRMKLDADDPWATPAGVVVAGGDDDKSGGRGGGGSDGGALVSTRAAGSGAPFRRTDVVLRLNRAVVLLRTSLGEPLLELDVRNTTLSYQSEYPDLSRSYAYLNVSGWTHNSSLCVWEPLLEPWEILAHLDDNRAARPIAGVSPGTAVRITSTQSSVHVVLAASALKSLLEALPEWTRLASPEGLAAVRRQLAYGEAAAGGSSYGSQAAQQGLMTNALGCPVSLLTDLGDRQAVVEIQTDAEDVPVLLQPPPTAGAADDSRAAGLAPPPVPAIRMFVDAVSAGPLPEELLREGGLMVRIKVNGPVAELMPESSWGLYTRAADPSYQHPGKPEVALQGRGGGGKKQETMSSAGKGISLSVVRWDERFLLKLPVELSEQLLCPAPGDNQFDGVPLQLDVSLLACGAAGGPPRVVAAGTLPLQSDWLANEIDSLRNTAAAAAAAAAAAGTLSFLGADGDGVVRGGGGSGGAATGGSDVSETVDVRLFPTRVVHAGDGSGTVRSGRPTGHGEGAATRGAADEPPPMLLQLRLSLDVHQVDSSWQPFLSRARRHLPTIAGTGGDGRTGSAVVAAAVRGGRRALRLYGSDVWVPFGQMGGIVTSGPGGDILQASSFIPIRAGPGLVLERSSGPGGQPLELLRSLAVIINGCGAPLEVSLVAGDPEVASWTLLAGAAKPFPPSAAIRPGSGAIGGGGQAGSGAAAAVPPAPAEEEAYENERFIPLLGWSSNNLLPTERRRYSRHGQSYSSFPLVPLPPGWEWEGPWQVETAGHVDSNGWFYALDWPLLRYPPTPDQARRKITDMVRRRRWIRRRHYLGGGAKGAAGGGGGSPRRLLGVVAAGDRLPLPLGWESEGVELQVRPVAAAAAAAAEPDAQESHQWSGGLLMATLDEGGARLLCCRPNLATPSGTDKGSETTSNDSATAAAASAAAASAAAPASAFSAMAVMPVAEAEAAEDAAAAGGAAPPRLDAQQPAWLSVSLECEALVATSGASSGPGGGLDTLVDWRLVVRPPLTLHNTLPVAGRYIVWERPALNAPMRVRQQGRVAAGASVPVFSADMRMQVYLSYAPDGCEYGESDPVLLSDGFMRNSAGVAPAPRPPDSFRCTYSHSASFTPLRLNLLREVDTFAASGVFAASGRRGGLLTPGEAVAHGYPLSVSLHVPIWLLNATQLPVSCGVMAFEAPAAAGPAAATAEAGGGGAVRPDISVTSTGGYTSGAAVVGGSGGAGQPPSHVLRILDTEAFRNSPRPSSYVSVLPRSLELLSYPLGVPGLLAVDDDDGGTGNNNLQVAVVLRLYDSRWTQPIYLPRPGEQVQSRPGPGGVSLLTDRLLIRALCKDGCIHEVAVRLDSAPLGLGGGLAADISMAATRGSVAVLIRLEHHVVLTNTTGYPLVLLQPELATANVDSGAGRGSFRGQGGGSGSNYQPVTVTNRAMSVAIGGGDGGGGGSSGSAGRNPAMAPALTVSIPPGSIGVPLLWAVPAASRHQLCLALPLEGETATSATAYGLPVSVMWSEPLKVDMSGGQDAQVALPVYCLGPVGRYHSAHTSGPAAGALAAMAALSNMTPQQQRLFELQRAHAVARQMFAALSGGVGGNVSVGDPGVGPRSFKLDNAGSNSSTGSGTAAEASSGGGGGGGGSARKGSGGAGGSSGMMFTPGVGPGLLKIVREASGGDAEGGGQQGGDQLGNGGGPTAAGFSSQRTSPPSLEPNLVRIVRLTELGNVEFLAVLLNVRLVMRAPGCLTLQLTSLGGQPQHLLHNGTPNDLTWRQAAPRAAWAKLPGYSAAAACRGVLGESWGAPLAVELRDTEPQSESSLLITTDLMAATAGGGGVRVGSGAGAGGLTRGPHGGGGPLGAAAGDPGQPVMQGIFSVRQKHREVMAQACSPDDLVLTPEGLCPLPGAGGTGLGASRLETVVRMVVVPPPLGPAAGAGTRPVAAPLLGPYFTPAALYSNGGGGSRGDLVRGGGGGGVSSSTYVTVSIGSLELSLVDGRPEEIAVLTVDDLTAELMTGKAAGVDFFHLSLQVRSAQLDDQIPGSAYPVVLQPLEQYGSSDPLFVLHYCCQPGKLRTALHCPVIAARLLPLRLSLAETLMWRVMALAKNVGEAAGGAPRQALEQRPRQQQQQVAGSDFPLAIDLMVVEDLPVRLSFRAEATFRPRWASGGFMRLGLNLAQLEDLALELPGIELERVRLLRSALLKKVYDRLQDRIFSMALAVLRSAGIVGGISKMLAVSSAGVAQLASDSGKGAAAGSAGGAAGRVALGSGDV
ncbi:hypothetical protein VaNZ11_000961, partial [Volvox africanus]